MTVVPPPDPPPDDDADLEVARLCETIGQLLRDDPSQDISVVIDRYPHHAEALRQVLPTIRALAGLQPVRRDANADEQAAQMGDRLLDEPLVLNGEYRLLREIGRGGMGIVYEAEQLSLGRRVAVKILPFIGIADSRILERFKSETRAIAALRHRHIVPIYGVGFHQGIHYFAMQFVDGIGLDRIIARLKDGEASTAEGTMDGRDSEAAMSSADLSMFAALSDLRKGNPPAYYRRVAELTAQAAEALHHAHQYGVVHRDVKPANLLLDREGNLWMTDFGLARMEGEDNLTTTGAFLGTLPYMSPEQALGKPGDVDGRTDVFALGATLYELLCLVPARGPDIRREPLQEIVRTPPKTPRSVCRSIPRDLETIVLTAMEVDPQRRYPTAAAMSDDLRRFCAGELIHARRRLRWERHTRWARRYGIVMTAIAVNLILLGILASSVWWPFARSTGVSSALRTSRRQRPEVSPQNTSGRQKDGAVEAGSAGNSSNANAEGDALQRSYARDLMMARDELLTGNVDRCDEVLSAISEPARGWEWDYLRRLYRATRFHVDGLSEVLDLEFLHGTPFIASLSGDGVDLIDRRTRNIVFRIPGEDCRALAADVAGSYLAFAEADQVQVWDYCARAHVMTIPAADLIISDLVFSPDRQFLACASLVNASIRVWDLETGEVHRNIVDEHFSTYSLAYSPDAKTVVSGSGPTLLVGGPGFYPEPPSPFGIVKLWDSTTGEQVAEFQRPDTDVTQVAFSPNGKYLASADRDGFVNVWDFATRTQIASARGHRGKGITGLVFAADGAQFATCGDDGTLTLWDTPSGRALSTLRGHRGPVSSIAYDPRTSIWATGGPTSHPTSSSNKGEIHYWDSRHLSESGTLHQLLGAADGLAFSPDGRYLASGMFEPIVAGTTTGPTAFLRDLDDARSVAFYGPSYPIVFDRHSRFRRLDSTITRDPVFPDFDQGWDIAGRITGGVSSRCYFRRGDLATELVAGVGFSESRVTKPIPSPVVVVDLSPQEDGRDAPRYTIEGDATAVQFSPDESLLGIAFADGHVGLCDVSQRTPGEIRRIAGGGNGICFSSDGRLVASAEADGRIAIFDVEQGVVLRRLSGHSGTVASLTFRPDGSRLASAGSDGLVRLWDPHTGNQILTLNEHTEPPTCVAFSPDGNLLASADQGGAVRLWNGTPLPPP